MTAAPEYRGTVDGAGVKGALNGRPEKPPLDLIWPGFILGIGRALGHGATKYSRGNWMRGLPWGAVLAAIQRHALAIQAGEDTDPETGELHAYHIACGAMFLAYYQAGPRAAEYRALDDRLFSDYSVPALDVP